MSRNWKKYGSPYDPGYEGKSKRPADPVQSAQEERQYQTRGCGDPSCAQCNPETAARFRGGSFRGYVSLGEASEEILRSFMVSRGGNFMSFDEIPAKPKNAPPASYTEAKERVKDWLSTAPEQDFEDIIGNEEALEQLKDAIQAPVKFKELYEAYGMKMPKGALLSGPPGCGKTMFARAAAAEMRRLYADPKKGFEFISISGSELQSMYVGETEAKIKAIFVFAREYRAYHGHPLLVFMDEAEVLLPDRTGRVRRVAPWEESQVATFLAEMDGMQESGAFMLLATNRPEVIDQAVLRDGRCDFKIVVKRPTREAIESIIRKNFIGQFMGATEDELVFAAVEILHDPHKIIKEAHALGFNVETHEVRDLHTKHFLLEHIISGAMAASIPSRAKRYAFSRDKLTGKALGIMVEDVVKSVNDLYEENKGLEHSFALEEFKTEFLAEADKVVEGLNKKGSGKLH